MKNEFLMMIRKNIVAIILCFVTFLVGFWFFETSIGYSLRIRSIMSLIGFIPFLFFVVVTGCIFKFSAKENIRRGLSNLMLVLILFLIPYYCGAIFICAFIEADNPVGIEGYKAKVNEPWLLQVFPREIPDDVEDVSFVYSPGVLQGGTVIALYYVDPDFNLKSFEEMYQDKAVWIGYKDEYTDNPGLFSGAFYGTPAYDNNEDDFVIYLVDAKCDKSGYCNHGKFLFVAFNEETNEVIYKAEQW